MTTEKLSSIEASLEVYISGDTSAREIASRLFAKAPAEWMERLSAGELKTITIEAFKAVQDWTGNTDQPLLRSVPSTSGVLIVLRDCPFIVNTIVQTIRSMGLQQNVLLHPVLKVGGSQVSLSYLGYTGHVNSPQVENALRDALSALLLTVSGFTAMHGELERIAGVFRQRCLLPQGGTSAASCREQADFLEWLVDGNFILLGQARLNPDGTMSAEGDGLLSPEVEFSVGIREEIESVVAGVRSRNSCTFALSHAMSPIHRRSRLAVVCVPVNDEGFTVFTGMLTSKAMAAEAASVPIVRLKLVDVLALEDLPQGCHDHKSIIRIFDTAPRAQTLALPVDALKHEVDTTLLMDSSTSGRVIMQAEPSGKSCWCIAIFPVDRFHSDLKTHLERKILELLSPDGRIELDSFFAAPQGASTARMYTFIPKAPTADLENVRQELERRLNEDLTLWADRLTVLANESGVAAASGAPEEFRQLFNDYYQALYSPEQALADYKCILRLNESAPVAIDICTVSGSREPLSAPLFLSVFRLREATLSSTLPALEHAGFEVVSEDSFRLSAAGREPVFLQRFNVRHKSGLAAPAVTGGALRGLEAVLSGRADDDILNTLLFSAQMDPKRIALLRTLCLLLWQMRHSVTRHRLRESLVTFPHLAASIAEMFATRFDPGLNMPIKERDDLFRRQSESFLTSLTQVKDIDYDRTLRALCSIIGAAVRTNYFSNAPTIAIKIHSQKLDILSGPRPMFEIFVNGPKVEGVHLRASRVARGGIRWSDRRDDYRAEVLGLMRTQKIKNAVIVPSGAKGGFYVKLSPAAGETLDAVVREAYSEFIRSLLSLTDNLVEATVRPPADMLAYDEPDPYLVVAADKGTAKFSDLANSIAVKEFNFWLGDAFASGGSAGYDHKGLAITARGAWECARQHMFNAGINPDEGTFTAVGIGDMSGDVFGNGMLLSSNMKLIAAFDHRHIFIDPNPDPQRSFTERSRLFALPRSSWADYSTELLSSGGMVCDRQSKEITLSSEARQALSIEAVTLSAEQLVSEILRAPVDLLWNGGIGTYVKAAVESNEAAQDSANDRVRVNAEEVRAKVVAEGGNLGFTQMGRIEYARKGGRINTDAIDNSAGVDLSDHEVNLKLLLGVTAEAGRDAIVRNLAPAVCGSVLCHNRNQSALLSISESRSPAALEYFRPLMAELSARGYIHAAQDRLPDEEALRRRAADGAGLYRPELAVCLAGTKLWLTDEFLNSGLVGHPFAGAFLERYFPAGLPPEASARMKDHPLKEHIIASEAVNRLVDVCGIVAALRLSMNYSSSVSRSLEALLTAAGILDVFDLREKIDRLHSFPSHAAWLESLRLLGSQLRDTAGWIMNASVSDASLLPHEQYADGFRGLMNSLPRLPGAWMEATGNRKRELESSGLDSVAAGWLAATRYIPVFLEAALLAKRCGVEPQAAASVLYGEISAFELETVLFGERTYEARSRWEQEFITGTHHEIRRNLAALGEKLLRDRIYDSKDVVTTLRKAPGWETFRSTLIDVRSRSPEPAILAVLARQVALFRLR